EPRSIKLVCSTATGRSPGQTTMPVRMGRLMSIQGCMRDPPLILPQRPGKSCSAPSSRCGAELIPSKPDRCPPDSGMELGAGLAQGFGEGGISGLGIHLDGLLEQRDGSVGLAERGFHGAVKVRRIGIAAGI